MRSKITIYNIIAATIMQMVNLIIGMILPRIILNTYGSIINGLISSIKQFIGYLNLAEAGLSGASIYALYEPLANEDKKKVNAILSATKKFYDKTGGMVIVGTILLTLVFPVIVADQGINNKVVMQLVLILGINGALEFFTMGKYRALLTADQKGYVISIIQMIGSVVNASIIIVLALSGYNIVIVHLLASISFIVRTVLFVRYIKKHYLFLDFKVAPNKEALRDRFAVWIHQINYMMVGSIPMTFTTILCGLLEVSIYSVYNIVFAGVTSIIGVFCNGLTAGFGSVLSKDEDKVLKKAYQEYECIYYMLVTWIYSCSSILIMPFIQVYTKGINDVNYLRKEIAVLFVIIGILCGIRTPQDTLVNSAGHFKQTQSRVLLQTLINTIASLVLGMIWGLKGIMLGTVLGYLYRAVDLIIYVPKYITKLPIKITLIRIIRLISLLGISVLPFIIAECIYVTNFFEWIIWAIVVAIWSGIVVVTGNYVCEKNMIINIVKRFTSIILR